MTEHIAVGEPRELLALIPHQLGFHPTDSAVAVSMRRGTVTMTARLDLGDLADPVVGLQLARSIVTQQAREHTTETMLVCYTPETVGDVGVPPFAVWAALANYSAACAGFLTIRGVLVVDPTSYRCLDDEGLIAAPGRPLSDLASTKVAAYMVLTGSVVAPNRDAIAVLPSATNAQLRAANEASVRWNCGDSESERWQWRRESMQMWRTEVAHAAQEFLGHDKWNGRRSRPSGHHRSRPSTWGKLSSALQDIVFRDAVLLALVVPQDVDPLPERTLDADRYAAEVEAAMSIIMDGAVGEPPDLLIVEPSRTLLRRIVAHARDHRAKAPGLTLLALIAWWQGKGAEANSWIERALDADPDYRLGLLIDQALAQGVPPGWVKRREAS